MSRPRHPARQPAGRTTSVPNGLRRSLQALTRALSSVEQASGDVLGALEVLRSDARLAEQRRVIAALAKSDLLSQLVKMEAVLRGRGDEDPKQYAAVPTAVLHCLTEALQLEPYLEPGVEREISSTAADRYEWLEPPPEHLGLVRLRILAPGWKWRGEVVVRPRAAAILGP